MDLKTIKLLGEYNAATNIKMGEHIVDLTTVQWGQIFEGYFPSVKSLCNHIYIADFNWLQRFSNLRPFEFVQKKFFVQTMRFDVMVLDGIEDYLEKREKLDEDINAFVNEINVADLELKLTYQDSRGTEFRRLFGGLVLHMFNHQTHHRGMISIYLENLGIHNDYSNLMDIL